MKVFYCLFLFSAFFVAAQPQDSVHNVPQEVVYDLDSYQEIQKFDEKELDEYRQQKDFQYTEYQEADTWWTRFKRWIHQLFRRFFKWILAGEITGFWLFFLTIFPYLIVAAVLILLVWLFSKVNPSEILLEKQPPAQILLTEDEDIIHNQDIQELIQQALQNNNYRLAIRYYYLLVLKKLSEVDLIRWESQKTNEEYSKELKDTSLQQQFQLITKLYDYIWYGSFEVNKQSYLKAEKEFQSITRHIQN
ncbi:DUF4129 domain-containing protein [Aquimarina sp. U1-2]|uniref:DUF4129 domain-containing protein n=1 Tax=Aquimarina sp. U1-2 TaxID=2823141 RepID=UPI001AEC827B|nr:DUF4129 domain-containing protein [Aquimarina sp. U1-2]MBP2833427.1 DUF4129 domain-containing protein [Aquimarina sp. U1-2]